MQVIRRMFSDNLVILMLVYIAMSVLAVITSVSAQVQDKAIIVTDPEDATPSISSTQGTRWALLVGIAKYPSYKGLKIHQLKAPVKDVNALAEFLKDSEKSGFDADHVITLTDEEATRRGILLELNDIMKRAAPEDMVLFYFSGHGMPSRDSETTYLIPYDFDLSDVETTCIDFDDLARKIRRMEARKVVVILDACNSGGVKLESEKGTDRKYLVERYVKLFQESEGRALLLSSDESEVSWETDEYGVFTHFLLEGLRGKADTNENGIVTFTEVARYVEDVVPKYTRENFPQVQKPMRRYELGVVRGEIPLAINWDVVRRYDHQVFVAEQKELQDKRNAAIFLTALSGLDDDLKEFSLRVTKSAYLNAVEGEPLEEYESLLLQEIDALKEKKITAADYVTRAKAIHSLMLASTAPPLTQLQVMVNPEDAKVNLAPAEEPDRGIPPSSPNTYQVSKGLYRLSVERPGYAPYSREYIPAKSSEVVNVTLERLMGILSLRVEPADARVTIIPVQVLVPDDQIIQPEIDSAQPIGQKKLPVGSYQVVAEKADYETVREPIEIKANIDIQVSITLKPLPATILSVGLPEGTEVLVNDELVDLPHQFPPGIYSIRMERNGFRPVEMSRTLMAGQDLLLNPEWKRITGILQLQVLCDALTEAQMDSAGAMVTVVPIDVAAPDAETEQSELISVQRDSQSAKSTQVWADKELPIGIYRVTAEKEGYESAIVEAVEIRADAPAPVKLLLKMIKPGPASVQNTETIISPGLPPPISRTRMSLYSLALPGSGQHYGGRHASSTFFLISGIGAVVGAFTGYLLYDSSVDDYNDSVKRYNDAVSSHEIELAKQAMIEAHDNADTKFRLRQAAFMTLAGIWTANVLHAYIAGPSTASSSSDAGADGLGWDIAPQVSPDVAAVVVRHPL